MNYTPADSRLFPVLTDEELRALENFSERICVDHLTILQSEGQINPSVHVVLSGQLRVTRRLLLSDEMIVVHGPAQFSGDISVISGTPSFVKIQSIGPSKLLRMDSDAIRKMIALDSQLGKMMLTVLSRREHAVQIQFTQDEKLAALGKMSAGLAHELKNPAIAAQRASKLMLEAVLETPLRMLMHDSHYSLSERENLREFASAMFEYDPQAVQDPLETSDREEEMRDWLEGNGVSRASEVTPILAECGVTVPKLRFWQNRLGDHFVNGLFWMETVMRLSGLARDIETSTERIANLVTALRDYSYMDQDKFQEVNIHHGIETTLKVMNHKLKAGVTVQRFYDMCLPTVSAYPGELNQVWTNLIDNAVDAMDGRGTLTIQTRSAGNQAVRVEITDTGSGIPENIRTRIFEPFFTTKPQGSGTGLGLDITHRIVVLRHGGTIWVLSKPGETTFVITLPIKHAQ